MVEIYSVLWSSKSGIYTVKCFDIYEVSDVVLNQVSTMCNKDTSMESMMI